MTSPHLVPDEGRSLPRPRNRAPATEHTSQVSRWPAIQAHDYGESRVLDAVCTCGMRWHAMAGRRSKTRRLGSERVDINEHVRRGHCVAVRSVKFELYNSKIVAAHIVTALLSALDQIA